MTTDRRQLGEAPPRLPVGYPTPAESAQARRREPVGLPLREAGRCGRLEIGAPPVRGDA